MLCSIPEAGLSLIRGVALLLFGAQTPTGYPHYSFARRRWPDAHRLAARKLWYNQSHCGYGGGDHGLLVDPLAVKRLGL